MKILTIALVILLTSCGTNLTREDLLPDASGGHGEVLVLMDDYLWDGPMGVAVDEKLSQYARGVYLRPEPIFNYFRKDPKNMTHINQMSRLILKFMIDTDSIYEETYLLEKPNYFAKNQLFLILKDSDADRMYKYILEDFDECLKVMNKFESDQLVKTYKESENSAVKELSEKHYGISISIPDDTRLKVDEGDFTWVKRERSKNMVGNPANNTTGGTYWIQQGILFWSELYVSPSQMTVEGVLQKRDSILKYHVPGKEDGSYMSTEYDPYYSPKGTILEYNGVKTVNVQGLWKHGGNPDAFGGGPFIQRTFLHPTNGMVVTIGGYIYAPKFNKREYLRELDAMLKTIDFI